jgi:murein DD-endopeptidase MepM/ murein hydrolase activator NlpD
MHFLAELFRSSSSLRAIALALITIGAAGCSAESTRFNSGQSEVTGSIQSGQAAPVGRVETRPLPQTSQLPPPQSPSREESGVVAGGGRGMASYSPSAAPYNPPAAPAAYNSPPPPYNPRPAAAYNPPPSPTAYSPAGYSSATYSPASYNPAPEVTGSVVAPTSVAPTSVVRKSGGSGQWSWDGGTAVTVAQGETVETIAHRHGVPVGAVLEANNLASPNSIQPGQRLVIPRYIPSLTAPATVPTTTHAAEAVAPKLASASSTPVPAPTYSAASSQHAAAPVNSGVHVVAAGDTLTKIAHQYSKSVAEIVKANNIQPTGKLNIGDRIVIPGTRVSNAKPEVEQAAAPIKLAANKIAAAAGAAPTQSASLVTPTEATIAETAPKAAVDATPGFRWPVRGRIIAGFGPKPNGQQNDGIDVAVPENTPIKAAEDGEVAYAGNELKGYGNLVLVKHPNGYVTAYAHAKELLVKRGDKIKRGEVIAKSGQSGNVDAPQLHFEVRKGSAPVDPMQFLNGA